MIITFTNEEQNAIYDIAFESHLDYATHGRPPEEILIDLYNGLLGEFAYLRLISSLGYNTAWDTINITRNVVGTDDYDFILPNGQLIDVKTSARDSFSVSQSAVENRANNYLLPIDYYVHAKTEKRHLFPMKNDITVEIVGFETAKKVYQSTLIDRYGYPFYEHTGPLRPISELLVTYALFFEQANNPLSPNIAYQYTEDDLTFMDEVEEHVDFENALFQIKGELAGFKLLGDDTYEQNARETNTWKPLRPLTLPDGRKAVFKTAKGLVHIPIQEYLLKYNDVIFIGRFDENGDYFVESFYDKKTHPGMTFKRSGKNVLLKLNYCQPIEHFNL